MPTMTIVTFAMQWLRDATITVMWTQSKQYDMRQQHALILKRMHARTHTHTQTHTHTHLGAVPHCVAGTLQQTSQWTFAQWYTRTEWEWREWLLAEVELSEEERERKLMNRMCTGVLMHVHMHTHTHTHTHMSDVSATQHVTIPHTTIIQMCIHITLTDSVTTTVDLKLSVFTSAHLTLHCYHMCY